MKRFLSLCFFAIFFVPLIYAQQPNMSVYDGRKPGKPLKMAEFFKKLHYSDEFLVGVGLDNRSVFSFGNLFSACHRFGDTVSLGLGTGLVASSMLDEVHYFYTIDDVSKHYSMKLFLPLFVRVEAAPWRFGAWRPFGRLDVGGMFRLTRGHGGGFFFSPAVGSHFQASPKLNLFFALSSGWMQAAYLYDEHLGQPATKAGSSAITLMLHAGLDF